MHFMTLRVLNPNPYTSLPSEIVSWFADEVVSVDVAQLLQAGSKSTTSTEKWHVKPLKMIM